MPFIRRLYQAHGDKWHGISESQDYINRKIAIANDRIHGTTRKRPIDILLSEEIAALKPLPAITYEIEEFHEGKVRKDGHVRFRNKYYSVEEKHRGQKVVMIGDSRQVSIYHKGKLIEVHDRITDPYVFKSTKPCHMTPWQRSTKDGSYYRKMAARLGPYVEKVILKLLMQGNGFIDTRKIWGILSLDKKYSADAINEACQKAVSIDVYSYRTVLAFLNIGTGRHEKEDNKIIAQHTKTSKFVRAIEEYKQLLN